MQTGASAGSVTLTAEQRTRIQQTVLARSDVPRVNRVNFALSVGTIVPTSVRVVEVPDTLIEIHPEWRGDLYFVAEDDIIIVDHSHRIVATIPMQGSSTHSSMGGVQGSSVGGVQGSSTAMHLGRDEIRQVQIMLNQKGFNIGEPDGVLGERTKRALIEFQRGQGLQASGQIDQHTMSALGVSSTGTQPSSMGQAGGAAAPSANQGAGSAGNSGASQPSTAGTNQPSAAGANQPSAAGANQPSTAGTANPSTAGQGGATTQQPAANPPATNPGAGSSSSGSSSTQTPQNMNPSGGSSNSMPQRQTR